MGKRSRRLSLLPYLTPLGIFVLGVGLPSWRGAAQLPLPDAPAPGGPLPGLTPAQLAQFGAGRDHFLNVMRPQDGLGPVFNGISCFECHNAGAPGGAGNDLVLGRVTRIGRIVNGSFSTMPSFGGPVIQRRSLREIIPNHPVFPEVVPPEATIVARRITTPLFGLGLIEAIPDNAITINADPLDLNADGISGRPNYVLNPETNEVELGRFGWKAQVSTIHYFTSLAFQDEMGITNQTFPVEHLPQGQAMPPGGDLVPDPEDDGSLVDAVTSYQRLLAPPSVQLVNKAGRNLFSAIGCGKCHVPTLKTGAHPIAALANKDVNLYSDLLLHDMGPGLSDGTPQEMATPSEFRTAPLWGLRFRSLFLHDGRATSIDAAIRQHGGEAQEARTRYESLSPLDRIALLNFLRFL